MTAPWPQDQTDILIRLWTSGMTSGEIARQLNITRNQVMGKVNRLGLKRIGIRVNHTPKTGGLRCSKPADKRPPAPLKPQAAKGRPIPFIAASDKTCKWPLWNGPKTGKVCGATPVPAAPYCRHHYDKAFTRLWSRRKTG